MHSWLIKGMKYRETCLVLYANNDVDHLMVRKCWCRKWYLDAENYALTPVTQYQDYPSDSEGYAKTGLIPMP